MRNCPSKCALAMDACVQIYIICVNCINIFSLLYSTVLCIIYVPLYYVLFLLEEIKNYYYHYHYYFIMLICNYKQFIMLWAFVLNEAFQLTLVHV